MSESPGAAPADTGRLRGIQLAFSVVAFATALLLFALIPDQTTWLDSQPLTKQPALWSIVSIGGMLIFGLFELIGSWRRCRRDGAGQLLSQFVYLARALEFVAWFMAYVYLVPIVGYLPVTLTFCLLLVLRLGYRSKRMLIAAVLTGLFTVLIFKSFLSVKIPGAAAYEALPAALRNFMILYF